MFGIDAPSEDRERYPEENFVFVFITRYRRTTGAFFFMMISQNAVLGDGVFHRGFQLSETYLNCLCDDNVLKKK